MLDVEVKGRRLNWDYAWHPGQCLYCVSCLDYYCPFTHHTWNKILLHSAETQPSAKEKAHDIEKCSENISRENLYLVDITLRKENIYLTAPATCSAFFVIPLAAINITTIILHACNTWFVCMCLWKWWRLCHSVFCISICTSCICISNSGSARSPEVCKCMPNIPFYIRPCW